MSKRKGKVLTVAEVYKACPADRRTIIGDFYCVPMNWVSPTTGTLSGVYWIAALGGNQFGELTLTGKLLSTMSGKCDHYIPGWEETREEQLAALDLLVTKMRKAI